MSDTHAQNSTEDLGHESKPDNSGTTWQDHAKAIYQDAIEAGKLVVIGNDGLRHRLAQCARGVHDTVLAIVSQESLAPMRRRLNDVSEFEEDDPFSLVRVRKFLAETGLPIKSAHGENPWLPTFKRVIDEAYRLQYSTDERMVTIEEAEKARIADTAFDRNVRRWADRVAAAIDMNAVEVLDWSFARVESTWDEFRKTQPTLAWKPPAATKPKQKADLAEAGKEKPDDEAGQTGGGANLKPELSEAEILAAARAAGQSGDGPDQGSGGADDRQSGDTQEASGEAVQDGNGKPAIVMPENKLEPVQPASEAATAPVEKTPEPVKTHAPTADTSDGIHSNWWYEFDKRIEDTKTRRPVALKLAGPIRRDIGLTENETGYLAYRIDNGEILILGIIHRD